MSNQPLASDLKAADEGDSEAMFRIAMFYYNRGKNEKATEWFTKAKQHGDRDADKFLSRIKINEKVEFRGGNNT